jgi:antirestriction protein ArdC
LLESTEQEAADLSARLAAIREKEDALSRNIAESGMILSAALYDQPLDEQSVRAHYLGTIAETVSDDELLGSLAPADQQRVEEWRAQLQKQRDEAAAVTDSTGEPALSNPRLAGWTEVGRAIFLFKEFIYLR